ncbi:Dihydroorotate dehydrogenase, electron transfer subunit, iron-sulfur cluster binding domain protein [Desulfarculus baarsii DSM 2075]|uniref:Dihydroorotate dehydrogenase, electron transfer subunit, iron-sulfur cluster binding domain protein n=2 Tax=Desulfarculus baarsii TaxID=453230 RepID=E1QMI6_DESB2|nr:Dihydroorotate dehydrogenase, electron transfer subunit, iron-sulfur cluster binding domain protein [Desulfarculus baarsii DSM 2075]
MHGAAIVGQNRQLARDVFLLSLQAPELARAAAPGQFLMLRVTSGPEPLLARPFSIHAVEGDDVGVLYRVVGRGTRLLAQATAGQRLELWGPLGRGFDLALERPLLVAGGMGIAPLRFAAQRLTARGARPRLLCGLASATGLGGLVEAVDECLTAQSCAVSWVTEDGSLGERGLVTALLDRALEGVDGVLCCGPMAMLRAVAEACGRQGVACQVSLEAPMACGVGACLGCVIPAADGGYLRACQEGPVLPAAAVDWPRLA